MPLSTTWAERSWGQVRLVAIPWQIPAIKRVLKGEGLDAELLRRKPLKDFLGVVGAVEVPTPAWSRPTIKWVQP